MGKEKERMDEFLHKELTQEIIGAAYEVHQTLGYGFLEKVYQRALKAELDLRGIASEMETPVDVFYKGVAVGEYRGDLLVDGKVMVEIKVAKTYNPSDEAQLLNELKGSEITVGLLINFGRDRADVKRMCFSHR